ncbi:MAG: CHASE domain-containing protein [Mariniblastus sp.]
MSTTQLAAEIDDGRKISAAAARDKLQSATRLHFVHWIIIILSLVLSFAAWSYAQSTHNAQTQSRFNRESAQVVELVQHRMKNYADALWGGVGMLQAFNGDVSFEEWKTYADSIQIEKKYLGINGIGVIHALQEDRVDEYLATQRKERPDFRIHPPHERKVRYPIGYIVPVKGNEKAVGLDIAHETNRYTAANESRDTGEAQITGPITLVQDDDRTPGFLFYAPYYDGGAYTNVDERRGHFSGLVYAPFVVNKLMEGVLEQDKRHVGILLSDGESVLYDEHVSSNSDFDPAPLYTRTDTLSLYGRTWEFDIRSKKSFREAAHSSQPLLILLGGIFIDAMLVLLFISISRSSKRALNYADLMTQQLETNAKKLTETEALTAQRALQLERSNDDLEQFAVIASHDLQEPLRKVSSFCSLVREEYGEKLDSDGLRYLDFAIDGAKRMHHLVQDLLLYSKIGSSATQNKRIDTKAALDSAILNLSASIEESGAEIANDPMPHLVAHERELVQVFQNLVGNAIKYKSHRKPKIHIGVESVEKQWQFSIDDNGIGIAPEYREKVFGIFKRLHSRRDLAGTGIGLAICRRIVERMGGQIWFETKTDPGCRVCFTIEKTAQDHANQQPL